MLEAAGNAVVLDGGSNCLRLSRIIVKQVERAPTKTDTVSLLSFEKERRGTWHTRGFPVANIPYCQLHLWGDARKPGQSKPESFARVRCQVKHYLFTIIGIQTFRRFNLIRFKSEVFKPINLSVHNKDGDKWRQIEIHSSNHSHLFQLTFYVRSNTVNLAVLRFILKLEQIARNNKSFIYLCVITACENRRRIGF